MRKWNNLYKVKSDQIASTNNQHKRAGGESGKQLTGKKTITSTIHWNHIHDHQNHNEDHENDNDGHNKQPAQEGWWGEWEAVD